MANTLTKPILLDETGVAIKTALNNINDTESQDWLLSYEDVHSEMDDNVDRIADALEEIKDILKDDSEVFPYQLHTSVNGLSVNVGKNVNQTRGDISLTIYADFGYIDPVPLTPGYESITHKTSLDVTSMCTFAFKDGEILSPDNNTIVATWVYWKTGQTFTIEQNVVVTVPTWRSGSLDDIKLALDAHYAGVIDLKEYWSVGDYRYVNIDAMTAQYSTDAFVGNNGWQKLVLLNAGGKQLSETNQECAFIVGLDTAIWAYTNNNELLKGAFDKETSENVDIMYDYTGNWSTSERRKWCNEVFGDALLEPVTPAPATKYSDLFKQFKNISASGANSNNTVETDDYFSVIAEKELLGENVLASAEAESSLFQFEYYKDPLNRNNQYGPENDKSYYKFLTRSLTYCSDEIFSDELSPNCVLVGFFNGVKTKRTAEIEYYTNDSQWRGTWEGQTHSLTYKGTSTNFINVKSPLLVFGCI